MAEIGVKKQKVVWQIFHIAYRDAITYFIYRHVFIKIK